MATTVTATQRRTFKLGMFADLTDSAHTQPVRSDGAASITFEADLTPETVAAIVARLESTDDVDQARRAALTALLPHEVPAVSALVRYVLGLPDEPVSVEPTPDAPT